jgi:4-amino-4-deoxy-L-arabinose transferase-like glycosyltransferase
MKKFLKFKTPTINYLLVIILLLGLFFRSYGINWDQGHHLHPDERMITMVTQRIHLPKPLTLNSLLSPKSSLNPKFFPYGSFPLYLLSFLGNMLASISPQWNTYAQLNLFGRAISGLVDLGVVILIYLIGKKIWSRKVGLLAGLFYALAVLPIQLAHFYAVDTLLNFFILATLYRLILFYEKSSFKNALLVGIFFGLSLASKISATVLISAIGITLMANLILIFVKRLRQIRLVPKIHREFFDFFVWLFSGLKAPKRQKLFFLVVSILKFGVVIIVVSAATFFIFEPYALIDFPAFWRQTLEQQQMTKSAFTFPYTLQYIGTTPYFYHLKNLVLWGMGIPLGITSLFATLYLLVRLIIEVPRPGKENQEAKILILTFFFLVYFLVVGRFAVKFMRYFLPLYPLFCLFAAWFFQSLIESRRKMVALTSKIVLIFVISSSLTWALAFISIYSKPNTRVSATQWINQNIPLGSKIAAEHWDDRVPIWGNYQFLEMPMYESDNSSLKWQQVNQNLAQADCLVLASNRLYAPLQKLADCQKYEKCYPKTAEYYRQLFDEELGFKKVAEFTSYPTLPVLNWSINDDLSDESFTVYDHPKVIVFSK